MKQLAIPNHNTHKESAIKSTDVPAQTELYVVNTLFSCLCTLEPDYGILPRWRPPFITGIKRQDRCHLNGLEIAVGRPKYVTAFGETEHMASPCRTVSGVVEPEADGAGVRRAFDPTHESEKRTMRTTQEKHKRATLLACRFF